MLYSRPLAALIAHLEKLPGVGPKSAQRLAFYLLRLPQEEVDRLADAMKEARHTMKLCSQCQSFSSEKVCDICKDSRRDSATLCVVADPKDIAAFERLNEYKGRYHVLHGLLSPIDGIGPEQIKVRELLTRLNGTTEVIVATNPTIEGEATALYLAQLLKPLNVKVTRLAHGIPIGGDLDFADQATLLSALEFRREI